MSALRRAVVQLRLEDEDSSIRVGSRTLYHFWSLLSPFFKPILLPPQRKTDGDGVTWTWDQPAGETLPTVDDLKAVRRRISDGHRQLVDALSDGPKGALTETDIEELRARMGRLVARFLAMPDRELMGYCARTAQGWMIHSWGAPFPESPSFPDESELFVSGKVYSQNGPVQGARMRLLASNGAEVGATRSDATGRWIFQRLNPGTYQVEAAAERVTFASPLDVTLESTPVSGLELRGEAQRSGPLEMAEEGERGAAGSSGGSSKNGPLRVLVLGLLLLGGAAGVWWWWGVADNEPKRAKSFSSGASAPAASVEEPAEAETRKARSREEGGSFDKSEPRARGLKQERSADVISHADSAISATALQGTDEPLAVAGGSPGDGEAPQGGKGTGAAGQPSKGGSATAKPWAKQRVVTIEGSEAAPSAAPSPAPVAATTTSTPAKTKAKTEAGAGHPKKPFVSPSADQAGSDEKDPEADQPSLPGADAAEHEQRGSATPTPSRLGPNAASNPSAKPKAPAKKDAGPGKTSVAPRENSEGHDGVLGDQESNSKTTAASGDPTASLADSKKPKKSSEGKGSTSLGAQPPATSDAPNSGDPGQDGSEEGHSGDATGEGGKSTSPKSQKTPQGGGGAGAKSGPQGTPTPTPSPASPGSGVSQGPVSPTPKPDAGWQTPLRGDLGAWTLTLAADEIVQTLPRAEGEPQGDVNAARARRLRELRAKISRTFSRADIHDGVRMEVPGVAPAALRWKDLEASPTAETAVGSRGAEVSWSGRGVVVRGAWQLEDASGKVWARVRLSADRQVRLLAREGVKLWTFTTLLRAPGEDAFHDRDQWAERLRWQNGREPVLPENWSRDDDWKAGHGHRLEVPLNPEQPGGIPSIRLIDTEAGWMYLSRREWVQE